MVQSRRNCIEQELNDNQEQILLIFECGAVCVK